METTSFGEEKLNVTMMPERVLIKLKTEEKTPGGIFLPDASKKRLSEGTIMAMGSIPKEKEPDMALKVNEHIFFFPGGGVEVKIGNDAYTVISLSDIFFIVR